MRGMRFKKFKAVCEMFGSFGILVSKPIKKIHNVVMRLARAKIREERFLLPTKMTNAVLKTKKAATHVSIVDKLN